LNSYGASGVLAKNDPLDERMIASFVAIMPTRPAPNLDAECASGLQVDAQPNYPAIFGSAVSTGCSAVMQSS